jgi:hypothetical protein
METVSAITCIFRSLKKGIALMLLGKTFVHAKVSIK